MKKEYKFTAALLAMGILGFSGNRLMSIYSEQAVSVTTFPMSELGVWILLILHAVGVFGCLLTIIFEDDDSSVIK